MYTIFVAIVPLSFLKSSASCLSVTISFMLTTLRCLSCLKIFISLMAVIGNPSFSLSNRTFFKATSSPIKKSDAHRIYSRTHLIYIYWNNHKCLASLYITCVFVLRLVHLAVCAFAYDPNYIKFVHTAFPPVTQVMFSLTITWGTNPGNQRETEKQR